MDRTLVDILLAAGATAWITTALVHKSGPLGVFVKFRAWVHRVTGGNSPFGCVHCASFWVGLVVVSAYWGGDDTIRALISLFGVLGIGTALRGASGEF
jgi:hypothetical protein